MRLGAETGQREFRRSMQCPARSKGRCILLSMELGWDHGLPIADCDQCWASGGPDTQQAALLRETWVALTVEHFSKPENAARVGRDVLVPLTVRHMTSAQVEALNNAIDIQFQIKREGLWAEVKHTWKDAQDFIAALKSRGTDNRRVSLPVLEARNVSCFGLTLDGAQVADPCPSLTGSPERGWWCGACGCGETEIARLDDPTDEGYPKLAYPILTCARRRKGFSNAE
jgi:hypothetical protein